MQTYDLPLDQLLTYRPRLEAPGDLVQFWSRTLGDPSTPPRVSVTPLPSRLRTVEVFDVRFGGYGDQDVAAWLLLPRHRSGRLPCVVEFSGYGGGRGLPHDWLHWSAFGYAHFVMDTRGQGGDGRVGVTSDVPEAGASPHAPGFLTLGLPDRDRYYYRRLYVDAVRAVDAAAHCPDVDPQRLVVAGVSQGAGLALASAALREKVLGRRVAAALIDVPFLAHFRRAAEVAAEGPYLELVRWLGTHRGRAADAFGALSCFDGALLAGWSSAPAMFSVALRDPVCPPSTVFAAYHGWGGEKQIRVWEWNEHEGGEGQQRHDEAEWLGAHLAAH